MLLAMTPLPTTPLLATASALGFLAWSLTRTQRKKATAEDQSAKAASKRSNEGPTPEQLLKLDTLELEVGYGLVSLVDAAQGGDLLDRIAATRRQLAVDMGFILPPVRIRDNIQLGPNEYRVKIKNAVVARGETIPGKLLAMDAGIATGPLPGGPAAGTPTKEPAFGLDAWWIDPGLKARAEAMNYTVVDPTSVLATHLTEIAKSHASELLTREEVNNLVAQLKEKSPKLVEEAIPAVVKVGELQKILQNLLRERVPIRDLETIVETLADWGSKTKDLDVLTEYVRNSLRRTISQQYATPIEDGRSRGPGMHQRIVCVTLDPVLEDQISAYVDRSAGATQVNMPLRVANQVVSQIGKGLQAVIGAGHQPVVIASPPVRAVVRQLLEPQMPTVAVLGYNEVAPNVEIESMGLIPPLPAAQATAA
jgi:flagellar biosynthesis protein FlhA